MPIPIPHPFQLDLVERTRQSMIRGNRIIVVQAATGAGKTTIAAHMTKLAVAKGSKVLFLVHRRKLVDQIFSRLEDFQVDENLID